ncbi:potassium-transporting ATPase subunit KdpC [Pseudomonas cremoricolorata]|uniref:potassium-transporting ATPase subunit KdpC n=1 Tax=Pseudomonas cremoricolorata TaxID=157783 RepID=UPI0004101C6D|nr:potassium-transporting ATPase subunit KdpC [Pseudomonas cremoricolorata]
MLASLRPALCLLALLTLLTGGLYPLLVTALGQWAFPYQANGSLLRDAQGQVRGSQLIAQPFSGAQWFHSRPSAGDYATLPSAASNLAASNPQLAARIKREAALESNQGQGPVPLALLTTSASGLDPHLPPAAVAWQLPRVAAARGVPVQRLQALLDQATLRPWVGPPVVNVLLLNQALAGLASTPHEG